MRVLHVVQHLHLVSGVTSFVSPLCDALKDSGIECDIAVQDISDRNSVCSMAGVPRIQIDEVRDSYDIVHIHNMWTPVLHRGANFARRFKLPIVWSVHGTLSPWAFGYKWWKKVLPWYMYQRNDLRSASVIHVTSPAEEEWARRILGRQRYVTIPMGARLPDRLDGGMLSQTKTLLFVGRLAPVKALDRLILAFQSVDHSGWRLRIVGQDECGTLKKLQSLSGADVEFVGPKSGTELAEEYDSCTVLALVSHTENFGAVVVDAMAHNKPVLTSTGTPWSEAPGWHVKNDVESLSQVLREIFAAREDQLIEKGRQARIFVEDRFSWVKIAERFKEVYGDLVCR